MILEMEYDYLYNYYNSTGDIFDFNNNSQLIIFNNANNGSHLLASSQTYTIMTIGQLLPLFLTFCLIYGLLLTLVMYFMSPDFQSSTHGERLKIVLKLFVIPDVNGDFGEFVKIQQCKKATRAEYKDLILLQVVKDGI